MKEDMEQNKLVTFDELLRAAQKEEWDFVNENINASHYTEERLRWALDKGLFDPDQNIRDLAVTLFDESETPLAVVDVEKLKQAMSDPYHIVRYRAAIALYKRGHRSPSIEQVMQEAKKDPDVGELASRYLSD